MSVFKKTISGLCAGAVLLSLAACGEDTAWANKIEGEEIRAGIYISYLLAGYSDSSSKLSDEGITEDLWNQQVEGKGISDYIKDYATQKCKEYIGTEKMFDEMGLVLTEKDEKAVELQTDTDWDNNDDYYMLRGVSKQSIFDLNLNEAKSEMIFDAYYEEGGISAPAEQEILDELKKTYAPVNVISIKLTDDEGNALDEASKAQKLAEAQELADKLENGEDFVTVYDQYFEIEKDDTTTDSSAEDVAEEEPDLKKYETIVYDGMHSYYSYPEVIISLMLEMEAGEVRVMTEYEGYAFVVLKTDILADEEYVEKYSRSSLISLKRDEFNELLSQYCSSYNVEINQKAYDRYDPQEIVNKK
ncbi:MAG: hypothetical protein WC900_01075 [Oscillospiraceae bacterium]|jgi:hypothetical protein